MASIYQSIEMLSKEKGIDPQIVLDAVKDAMLAAARKHFRSQEWKSLSVPRNKSGEFNQRVLAGKASQR